MLDALLADGWYRGQVGMTRAHDQWGTETAFLAQLEVEHEDGTTAVFGTDDTWRWSDQPHPGRRPDRGPARGPTAGRTGRPGRRSRSVDRGYDALVTSPAPPVRAVEELRPVVGRPSCAPASTSSTSARTSTAGCGLTDLGPEGTETTLTHGEALGPDGDVTMDHLAPGAAVPARAADAPARSTASSRRGVAGDVFEPRLTTHGFRYVRIEGHPGPLDRRRRHRRRRAHRPRAARLASRAATSGSTGCTRRRCGASAATPATSPPTARPASGPAGPATGSSTCPTASFLYDVRRLLARSGCATSPPTQWEDGTLDNMAPMPVAERTGFLEKLNGSAGWGDAIVLVPWELHQEYGDTDVLARVLAGHGALARAGRADGQHRAAPRPRWRRTPSPRPHEQYLWDTGFHWGEWLEPGGGPVATSRPSSRPTRPTSPRRSTPGRPGTRPRSPG